jgi:glucose-1-phosphate thymidylyltransferase
MVDKAIVMASEPSVLLSVANRPLVVHALDALAEAGVRRATVAAQSSIIARVEHELAQNCAADIQLTCVEQDGDGGLPAALADLEGFVGRDPFVLHLGDSLNRECLSPLLQAPTPEHGSTVLVRESDHDDTVVQLAPRRKETAEGSAAGVWVFGAGSLGALSELATTGSNEIDVACGIETLAELGGRVELRHVGDWWRFNPGPNVLLEANRFVLEGLKGSPVEARLTNTQIQGPVSIHPTAQLESSIVRGPAVIAAGVCLRDAYVGPYTSIGEDVLVEGAEVEYSIILRGASVTHLGGRLEASVVGANARVFRDFRLPRAMRLNVGEGAEVSLA